MGLSRVDVVASGIHKGARYSAPVTGWWPTDVAWLRDARLLPDSLLHQRRRRAALKQLRRLKPRRILFVCHGNICRSPFAAAVFPRVCPPQLRDHATAVSAGVIGPGRTPPPQALAAAFKYGIEMSAHRSALVTEDSLTAADLVVVMSAEQARDLRSRAKGISNKLLVLGDLDPSASNGRTITDPWDQPDSVFDASYRHIARCVIVLARSLAANP